ncbi:hypothetical protein [Treponema sp.]|uniref:hypothetical protein n=1 Tax=Treponema sp. TaxID=166 RepID=UPI003EFD1F6F
MKVEAWWDTEGLVLARKSVSVIVKSGETSECSIALILLADSIMDSEYYLLWRKAPSGMTSVYQYAPIKDLNSFSGLSYDSLPPYVSMVEDLYGNVYYMNSSYELYSEESRIFNFFGAATTYFNDCLYYDATTNSTWALFENVAETGTTLGYSKFAELQSSTDRNWAGGGIGLLDFTDKTGLSFAIQGNVLYFAYADDIDNHHYLQRAIITIDDTSIVSLVGSAKSVEQMGFSGEITDIYIHYDGTVYVLISNVGDDESENIDGNIYYNIEENNTYYSRGALLKIESTSSGFEVVDSLGWTENSRTISPVGNAVFTTNGETYTLKSKTAYIPQYTESGSKFYGPRRFVAIKPKEIAIADCGFNIVMPDADKSLNGKLFNHNRVLTVNLRDFAISSSKEYRTELKFTEVNFSSTIGATSTLILVDDGTATVEDEK